VKRADERHQLGSRRRDVLAGNVELGAVAGREHGHLAAGPARSPRRERAQSILEAARLEIDTLAQLNGRGAMTDSDEKEVHSEFQGSRVQPLNSRNYDSS
jgi:hypothetical protein